MGCQFDRHPTIIDMQSGMVPLLFPFLRKKILKNCTASFPIDYCIAAVKDMLWHVNCAHLSSIFG